MSDDPDSRYQDILRRIAARRRAEAGASHHRALSEALDALNATGALEDLARRRWRTLSIYGPAIFPGFEPDYYVGVLVWCKPRGYYHYEILHLAGAWAMNEAGAVRVMVGTKPLTFSAPVFNPESYYHHIRRRFDLYYQGNPSPPREEGRALDLRYDPADRLAQRAAVSDALQSVMARLV